ncbi:caspase, EACC1-associated type [Micromonospora sp. NPDC004704]
MMMVDPGGPTKSRRDDRHGGLANAVVLLCGTGRHEPGSNLPDVPAIAATLADLSQVLAMRCGARKITVKLDLATPMDLGEAISDAARRAEDILVIYYVGHGLVSAAGDLFLAARQTNSRPHRLAHTAFPYRILRQYAMESRARSKIVILDCCFSGRAIGTLGASTQIMNLTAIEGAFVLASAGREEVALAPHGARHTAFTGALIKLLTEGDPSGAAEITIESAYQYLSWSLPAAEYPKPRRSVTGRAGDLVLATNPARTANQPPQRRRPPVAPRRARWPSVLIAAAAGAATVPFLVSGRHGGGWFELPPGVRGELLRSVWGTLLLILVCLFAALVAGRPIARLIGRLGIHFGWRRLTRLRVALVAALAFVLAVALGVPTLDAAAAGQVWLATCPPASQLRVLTTPEGYVPTRQLAEAFELDTARDNFDCPEIRVLVYAEPRGQTVTALGRGWSDDDRQRIGPRPDVWLPDSTVELRLAEEEAETTGTALPVVTAEVRSVASTPLVLGVADRQVVPAGSVEGLPLTGASWPKLLDSLESLGWGVIAPDPAATVGELARLALYTAAAGDPERGVAPKTPLRVERYVGNSYDRAGYPPEADIARLLCVPERNARENVAFVLTEQSLARFNQGAALGTTCAGSPQKLPASDQLKALYPASTPVLDHPFVRLAWDNLSAQQTSAARRFGAWLDTAAGRSALTAIGLRPPEAEPGSEAEPLAPISTEYGVQPGAGITAMAVAPEQLRSTRDTYAEVHRPGRVLVALDASGSMTARGPDDRRLWDSAVGGVTDSVSLMGPRDSFGVWSFQGEGTGGIRRLVPIARPDGTAGEKTRTATSAGLATVTPGGPAPLYSTIVEGIKTVGRTTEDQVTALVIVTDGQDDNASPISAGQFEAAVRDSGVRVFALAVGTTSCRARELQRITGTTGGSCREATPGTIREELATIVEALWETR